MDNISIKNSIALFFCLFNSIVIYAQTYDLQNILNGDVKLPPESYNSFLYVASNGNAWISSVEGPFVYNGRALKKLSSIPSDINVQSNFYEDKRRNIWFSSYRELLKYSIETKAVEVFRINGCIDNYHVFHLGNENIWMRACDSIYIFNVNQNKVVDQLPFQTKGKRFVFSKVEYNDVIFAAPWGDELGVELIFKENGIWYKSDVEYFAKNNIIVNQVIESQTSGNFYFITNLGLYLSKYNHFENRLEEFKNIYNDDTLIEGKVANGTIYLSRESGDVICLSVDDEKSKDKINSIPQLWNVNTDVNNNVYFSSFSNGVYVAHSKEPNFKKYLIDNEVASLLKLGDQVSVVVDSSKYQGDAEFKVLEKGDGTELIEIISHGEESLSYLYKDSVVIKSQRSRIIVVDIERPKNHISIPNSIWINTKIGLFQGNLNSKVIDLNETSFNKNIISQLFTDYLGRIVFLIDEIQLKYGVNADSLNSGLELKSKLNGIGGNDGTMFLATTNGILFCDSTYQRTPDSLLIGAGYNTCKPLVSEFHLFYGTASSGLHCYNMETGETHAFTTREGLPSNNFSPNAALKTDDGRLWFGTDKGLVVFHPDSISFDFCTPQMNIEEILVNNQYIQSDTYVGDMTNAELAYDENSLAIRGVAIDCMFSPDVKSYYRFTGVDTTWNEVKNGDYLRYDRLDPGDYKLEMYALSPNLVKSEIKAIDFTINLPYWRTWWFRLLCLAGIGGLAYGGIQLYVWNRLREERQKRLQLETQQTERNRIADELHDDLGGGLSVIRFLSEELQDTAADQRTRILVDKISSSSQQLLISMREVIWAMDTRNDTIDRLAEQIHDFASAYLGQHNVDLQWQADISDHGMELTGEKRRNIYLISKEVVHNITKHASASIAFIQLEEKDGNLVLQIRDNGQGYQIEDTSKGHGSGSMQRRAKAIGANLDVTSEIGEGTTIKLEYPPK